MNSEYEKLYLEKATIKLISYEIIIFIAISISYDINIAFCLVNGLYFLILNELLGIKVINSRKHKIRKLK